MITFATLKFLKSAVLVHRSIVREDGPFGGPRARKLMKLSEFKFDLPNNLIALEPSENRDESRLMVVHKNTGKIEHKVFKDIVNYFDEGDVMVGNDTMVFPARLYGRKEKTGAKIEVFLLRELNADMHLWDVLVDPARKIRVGNKRSEERRVG